VCPKITVTMRRQHVYMPVTQLMIILDASFSTRVTMVARREASSVPERPYVLLSCSMSIDGYVDDGKPARLLLSNDADFDRVDEVRASCDAILVGAATVRQDDPRLLVRSAQRRAARVARGAHPTPLKVTVTSSCDLDPAARFFALGEVDKLVYCAGPSLTAARARLGEVATVIDGGNPVDLHRVTADLHRRGVRRLMVEGGGTMHTQFLTAGLADELQLVVAPLFVGDSRAPRFVSDGDFPWGPHRRATLAGVRQIGDVVLLRYALSDRFES
jgi:5-amino-6-(5-phosphoribosylamino)uracil reductase